MMHNQQDNKKETSKPKNRAAEYIITIIINILWLYVINNLLNWNITFLTDKFVAVLWVWNLSIAAAILGNLLLLLHDSYVFRPFVKMIMNIFSFVAAYTLYVVYPFHFTSANMSEVIKIIVLVALIGTGIAIIVELVNLVKASIYNTK